MDRKGGKWWKRGKRKGGEVMGGNMISGKGNDCKK